MEQINQTLKAGVEKIVGGRWIMTVGTTGLIVACVLLEIEVPTFVSTAWGLMVGLYFVRTDRN